VLLVFLLAALVGEFLSNESSMMVFLSDVIRRDDGGNETEVKGSNAFFYFSFALFRRHND
jgi:hypothetical protein